MDLVYPFFCFYKETDLIPEKQTSVVNLHTFQSMSCFHALPALLLFWGLLRGSEATCTTAYGDKIRYCKTFQNDYIEGIEILIFEIREVGRINSTVFSSPNLKSVRSLTLKDSNIHTIESAAFQQFQGLGNIELQDNSLTTLSPSWFHDPATLKNLTVASNFIGRLRPEMLEGFSNLERLNLSRNQISSIHNESFQGLSKMASLDLSYNKISSLQWQTLSTLNGTLSLGGNPWNCSCAHKDFILFLKELMNVSRLADPSSVTCRYPPDMVDVLVWNISEMNCSSPALSSQPEAAFHKVVLPVVFVVLGGLFFSLSMCLIICILTSRCKNKVTNVSDSECAVHRSSENGAEHNLLKGMPGNHKLEERLVRSLPPCHETMKAAEIRAMMCTLPLPHSDEGKDLEMRTSKSEPLVLSIGVKAPVLHGEIVTCQTAVTVCPATELYLQDPRSSTSPPHTDNIENIETARLCKEGQSSSRRRSGNPDNETRVYGNPSDQITDLVTYFETHTDSENVSRTEGNEALSKHGVFSYNGNPLTFGKKCKTWSTFLEHIPQDKSTANPSDCLNIPKSDIEELIGGGNLTVEHVEGICDRERPAETSCRNGKDNQREEGRKSPGITHMDTRHGNYDITRDGLPHTEVTGDQLGSENHLGKSRAEEGPCRRPHQGPSNKTKTSKLNDRSSLAHEKLWKYHKNCCNEFEPCQSASKVLRQLKTLEKGPWTIEEAKQEPPPDEELLEEKTSLPFLLSKSSENQMSTYPAISSKKTCVSLPNLGVYGDHNPSAIVTSSPYTEVVIVQDETGIENNSKNTLVCTTDLPAIDLPAEDIVHSETVMDISPSTTNLPIIDVPTGGTLYNESGSSGPPSSNTTPRNSSGQDSGSSELDLQVLKSQDLVSYDRNNEVLPEISALHGRNLREDETSQVEPSLDLELPALAGQIEDPSRNQIRFNTSSTDLHLPAIDVFCGDNITGCITLQDNIPVNLEATILESQTQSVMGDKKFNDVSPSLPDVLHEGLLHKVDLPNMAGYSEALMINESDLNDILHCNRSLPPRDKMLEESKSVKPEKQRSNQHVKAKSCPALSAMLDNENRDRNPKYKRGKYKPDSKTRPVRDPRNTMMTKSHAKKFETSKEVPSNPVEAMNIHSQKSLPDKERELSPAGSSDITAGAETQLTSSGSYSISSQDGDDISEWPKTSDILKQSSTISLSSKYDILESSIVPPSKEDSDNSAVVDNGHNVVTRDFSTCGTDNLHVLQQCVHKAEDGNDQRASSHEEYMGTAEGENTSENTLVELSERQVVDTKTPCQCYTLDTVMVNDQTTDRANLMQTSNLDEWSPNDSEDCRKEKSDTTTSHDQLQDGDCQQFFLVNEQRPDPYENPSGDLNSLDMKFQTSHLDVTRSKDNSMESREDIGATSSDHAIHNVRHGDLGAEFYPSNLDISRVGHDENSHLHINHSDDFAGDQCKSEDTLTFNQEKVKNHHREDGFVRDENRMKEDSTDQSNLCSNLPRSKDVTSKFRKKIGAPKLEAKKPSKTDDLMTSCIQDLGQDVKDYISSRLSRRPFQSVFPIPLKTSCPEDGKKPNASYLEDSPFDNSTKFTNPPCMLSDTQSQPNVTFDIPKETSRKTGMTQATEYLTYLYARGPTLKRSPYPPGVSDMEDDKTKEDIRVLANLQFCKVSGEVTGDAEVPETVQEVAEDPKLVSSDPENLYIPPNKEELRADEELAVLHVMCTLKRSLELSTMLDADNRTDE
ncbi:uncharacterized protein RB166_020540 [Leptodactylus fuscus]